MENGKGFEAEETDGKRDPRLDPGSPEYDRVAHLQDQLYRRNATTSRFFEALKAVRDCRKNYLVGRPDDTTLLNTCIAMCRLVLEEEYPGRTT